MRRVQAGQLRPRLGFHFGIDAALVPGAPIEKQPGILANTFEAVR